MGKRTKANILVVDGFALERASMKAMLSRDESIGVIQEASGLEEAKSLLEKYNFELIILSLIALDDEGLLFLKVINRVSGSCPVLVLGPGGKLESSQKSMKLGVQGYVTKNEGKDVLLEGVHTLLRGEKYFPTVTEEPIQQKGVVQEKKVTISDREKEILQLVIMGMNNVNIGEKLNISVRTVENHRANMMRKLKVKNTAELVKTAILNQIVEY